MENETMNKNDTTKGKIILFVIGLLVGAIISTGSIYIYTLTANSSNNSNAQSQQMPGTPPDDNNGGTPPSMPQQETK